MGTEDDRSVELVWSGKYDARGARAVVPHAPAELRTCERFGGGEEGLLVKGDNLAVMDALIDQGRTCDLVYVDPPFATGGRFEVRRRIGTSEEFVVLPAYSDTFTDGLAGFLRMLEPRLRRIHALLSATGSLYVHVDPRVGHAVKLVLDEVFGPGCFQREIVWRIGWLSGFKTMANNWVRNHDLLYFYVKDPEHYTFNRKLVPHPPGYKRRDGRAPKAAGVPIEDVWNANEADRGLRGRASLDSIQITSFSREKTGWATQKNESLLRRIIEASSNQGDVVGDFFCGSGTTAVVARQLGRRFVACDVSSVAVQIARARLLDLEGNGFVRMSADARGTGAERTPSLRVERRGRSSVVRLLGLECEEVGEIEDPVAAVEAWSIAAECEPERVVWEAHRGRSRELETCSGLLDGAGPFRVRVMDVFGGESEMVVAVSTKR